VEQKGNEMRCKKTTKLVIGLSVLRLFPVELSKGYKKYALFVHNHILERTSLPDGLVFFSYCAVSSCVLGPDA
jgi:hypothetical protein